MADDVDREFEALGFERGDESNGSYLIAGTPEQIAAMRRQAAGNRVRRGVHVDVPADGSDWDLPRIRYATKYGGSRPGRSTAEILADDTLPKIKRPVLPDDPDARDDPPEQP